MTGTVVMTTKPELHDHVMLRPTLITGHVSRLQRSRLLQYFNTWIHKVSSK